MPPRLKDFRKVLGKNGFELARSRSHELWVQKDDHDAVVRRVTVSHGNAEIRTKGLFREMLNQAGKTEEHFFDVLAGR